MADHLTLIRFRCYTCNLDFYIPASDAADRFKHGLQCPRCRDGGNVHYEDWLELGTIVRVQGSDVVRRCAEAIAS